MRLIILVVAGCVGLAGCTSGLNPDEYIKYCEKNKAKFSMTIERNGVAATVTCLPREYYAAQAMAFDSSITLQKALDQYGNSFFIVIEVTGEIKGTGAVKSVMDRAEIFMTAGSDTIRPNAVRPEKSWRLAPSKTVVAAFDYNRVTAKGPGRVLHVRNLCDEIGTVEFPLKKIQKRVRSLKG